jgi:hypothetical protein
VLRQAQHDRFKPFALRLSKGERFGHKRHSCFDELSTNGLCDQHGVRRNHVRICLLDYGLLSNYIPMPLIGISEETKNSYEENRYGILSMVE